MLNAIDMFCHWLPPRFRKAAEQKGAGRLHMFARAASIPLMTDLASRFRKMDTIPGLVQVPSLVGPPVESMDLTDEQAVALCRLANDEMAELVREHTGRFAGFVAVLPTQDPEAAATEFERAVTTLNASGAQIYTNLNGQPPDRPWCLEVLQVASSLGVPVWLHPLRTSQHPDFLDESDSRHELWWALGWPHETSLAMSRLALAGVFDRWPDLKLITHHAGGTIPFVAGRFEAGMRRIGTRTAGGGGADVTTPQLSVDALRNFYADTASFGAGNTLRCAAEFFGVERLLFASDMPFGAEDGWSLVPETIRLIDQLFESEAVRHQVLAANAESLLRMPASSSAPRFEATVLPGARAIARRHIQPLPVSSHAE